MINLILRVRYFYKYAKRFLTTHQFAPSPFLATPRPMSQARKMGATLFPPVRTTLKGLGRIFLHLPAWGDNPLSYPVKKKLKTNNNGLNG